MWREFKGNGKYDIITNIQTIKKERDKGMKKLLGFAILIMAIFAVADSTKNTPMNVAARAMQCIVNNDFDGYACLHHLDINANDANGDKAQAHLIHPIATTLQRLYDKATSNGGLKSFEVLGEEVAADGMTATVNMNFVFGNGLEKGNLAVKLRKDNHGNWKVDASHIHPGML